MTPLCYWFVKKGVLEHVIFNTYTIDNGVIKNAKGEPMAYSKNAKGYNRCTVTDDSGKTRSIRVCRARKPVETGNLVGGADKRHSF